MAPRDDPAEARRTDLRTALRRVVKVGFALIQVLLLMRIVVLFFAPSPTDPLVSSLMDASQPFVDPFQNAVRASLEERASGTILDTHAMAALVGYTAIEGAILVAVGWRRRRREPLPPLPALPDPIRPPPARDND